MLRNVLLPVCFCLLLGSTQSTATGRQVDLELVLAADIYRSMDLKDAAMQRRGYVSAILHPAVIATIRRGRLGRIAVAYVEWAGVRLQSTLVDWTVISDEESAARFVEAVNRYPVRTASLTSISSAIDYAATSLRHNAYFAERQIIDISGDGPNNKGEFVTLSRDRAVADGITINGLPIINQDAGRYGIRPVPNLDNYYEDCVIGGPGAFVIAADGYKDFARAIRRKMVLEIAGLNPNFPRVCLAATGYRPPCNVGEQQLRNPMMNFGRPQ